MVVRKENETVDSLLRRFKKEVTNAGIINDYRAHLEYVSPSMKRKLKSEKARKRTSKKG